MKSNQFAGSSNFLVIEDNIADYRLVREAISDIQSDQVINFTNISDGNSAIDFFNEKENIMPDIIMLDLNIPRRSGLEVLVNIKKNQDWCHIPVIIFSSSNSPSDVEKSYKSGANAYIVKPGNLDDFFDTIRSVHTFWIQHATFYNENK